MMILYFRVNKFQKFKKGSLQEVVGMEVLAVGAVAEEAHQHNRTKIMRFRSESRKYNRFNNSIRVMIHAVVASLKTRDAVLEGVLKVLKVVVESMKMTKMK